MEKGAAYTLLSQDKTRQADAKANSIRMLSQNEIGFLSLK